MKEIHPKSQVYVDHSPIQGMGLFAFKPILPGKIIIEYTGPRVPKSQGRVLAENGNTFIFSLNRRYDIDGSVESNIARFANHSCNPNSEAIVLNDRRYLRSIRLIRTGEEITYDYEYSYSGHEQEPCHCGDEKCIKFIVHRKYWYRFSLGR